MQTQETLRRRIDSAEDLRSVVKTMKTLAAVSIQHFQEAAASLAEYDRTIATGLQAALQNRPEGVEIAQASEGECLGAIVIGSDQGMCGQFNEEIARYAIREMNSLGIPQTHRMVLAVGVKVLFVFEDANHPVNNTFAIPSSLSGITPMVQDILLEMEEWRANHGVDRIIIFYNEHISSASYRPMSRQVLPVDQERLRGLEGEPWPGRSLPTFTVGWNALFTSLIRQFLLVSVYRAIVESLTSESASRMAAMQAAEKNIDDKLDEFHALYHHQRQTSITEELLDIVGGFEALGGHDW